MRGVAGECDAADDEAARAAAMGARKMLFQTVSPLGVRAENGSKAVGVRGVAECRLVVDPGIDRKR